MSKLYVLLSLEVGYRAGHFEYSGISTGRKVQPYHRLTQDFCSLAVQHAILAQHLLCHLRVGVYERIVTEPLFLNLTCPDNPLTYLLRRFSRLHLAEVREWNGRQLYLQIDAVKQWAGYLIEVPDYLSRRAAASLGGMVVIATGAGVHGCHEHKGTREGDAVLGTRYIDDPILERLAKNLQYRALELGQLIQE